MFIDISKNNGKDYIRLVKSKRVMNEKGQKVARKAVILNVGPLEKYDDGEANYIGRLRKSFRAGIPIIGSLEKYCEKEQPRERYKIEFEEGNPNCAGRAKIYSYILIERIMEEIGLRNIFSTYKGFSKIEYFLFFPLTTGKLGVYHHPQILSTKKKSAKINPRKHGGGPVYNNTWPPPLLCVCVFGLCAGGRLEALRPWATM